jgi:hypothetical protein
MSRQAEYSHPPRVRRLLRSLVPIICPPEAEGLGVTDAVVHHVELSMRAFPAPLRQALLLGLRTYELGAIAWRGRPASRLSRERAAAWYRFWWKSPLAPQRELAKAIKALMIIGYYEMPAVQQALGYAPQAWIEQVKVRRLEVYSDAIRRHETSLIEPDPREEAHRVIPRDGGSGSRGVG